MPSPLIIHPDTVALMPPAYMGSIDYYATLASHATAVIDRSWRYNKRMKSTHRCDIVDTHGHMQLTVPVEKPFRGTPPTWNDVKVSTHGSWWNVHRVALESAYGRTPFFEYYIDRFLPFLKSDRFDDCLLMDLDCEIDAVVRDILGIDTEVKYDLQDIDNNLITDYRNMEWNTEVVPYYQIRQVQHGFVPHLTILDLIFNMGPESPLILKKMTK